MNKHRYCAAFAALLALVACNKNEPAVTACSEPGSPAIVNVRIDAPQTRATVADTPQEATVSTLDVCAFRGDVLDAHGQSNGTSLTLSATQGPRTLYAVVNTEESLTSVSSLSGLQQKVSLLANNSRSRFVMTGMKSQNLGATTSVDMDVERLAARFKIDKITNKLTNPTQASSFSITRIFLTNVVGNICYDASQASSVRWFADSKLNDSSAPNDLIYKKLNSPASVSYNNSHTTSYSFYTYPNSNAQKNTLLVVEAKIAGQFYTYPLLVAGTVERNKSYEVKELVITRVGNPSDGDDDIEGDENKPIQSSQATITINVLDWEQVLIGENGSITI